MSSSITREQADAIHKELHERDQRHYKASLLPIFRNGDAAPDREQTMLALYGEICESWRMLTDVRFKLLGFVPTVSGVVLITLLSRAGPTEGLSVPAQVGVIFFGLLITVGLFLYDRRNSELYDDLISRGRRIEDELGIDTGHFRGRPNPKHKLINHSNAVNLIYGTALAGWAFALAAVLLGWAG